MTSQHRCHDNCAHCRRRFDAEKPCQSTETTAHRYPIITRDDDDDDRSTGTGNSCGEKQRCATAVGDDVTRLPEVIVGGDVGATVHRRRRRTAFTSDQVHFARVAHLFGEALLHFLRKIGTIASENLIIEEVRTAKMLAIFIRR